MSYLEKNSWNSSSLGGGSKFCRTASMLIGLVVGLLQGQVAISAANRCRVITTVITRQNCPNAATADQCKAEWGKYSRTCQDCPNKISETDQDNAPCVWEKGRCAAAEEKPPFLDKCLARTPPSGGWSSEPGSSEPGSSGTGMETMSPE